VSAPRRPQTTGLAAGAIAVAPRPRTAAPAREQRLARPLLRQGIVNLAGRAARRWALRVAAAALGAAAVLLALPSCNTPFIPLPPPGDPTFTPVNVTDGMGGSRMAWETRGSPSSAMAEAKVFVYDLDLGAGVIVRAQPDGSYVAAPIEGKQGDRMQIRYESSEGHNSPDICRVLQPGLAQTDCQP
jgi:hypothetical protein